MKTFSSIDEYNLNAPVESLQKLEEMRAIIRKAAPKATEKISYGMPAFAGNKILVYYAGYKKHIGFYPMPAVLKLFAEEISAYKSSKGAVQFPLDRPLPKGLITKMVKQRVKDDSI